MGKRLVQQRRGRGSPTYRSPSFRFKGEVKHPAVPGATTGTVTDLVHCAGHSAPLMEVSYLSWGNGLAFAPEGIRVGDEISIGSSTEFKNRNSTRLNSSHISIS